MSEYLGISPPLTRGFATTLRRSAEEAHSLALDMARLLDAALITSAGPALATDVGVTMSAAAGVLEQRATIADLCRTDPGVLAIDLAASQKELWALLLDDRGVSLLDPALAESTADGDQTEILDRLWDLVGTGSAVRTAVDEAKIAARFGLLLRLQLNEGRFQPSKLLEYFGQLAQTPGGRRLIAYLAGSEASAALWVKEAAWLSTALRGLTTEAEKARAIGRWADEAMPRLAAAAKTAGNASSYFFIAVDALEALDSARQTHWADAADHLLWAVGSVLVLVDAPIAVGLGSVILTGLLIYDNREWIKRNLSPAGLVNIGTDVLAGIDTGVHVATEAIGDTVNAVADGFTDGLKHAINPMG